MRLKAEIWVKAYLRRCAVEGAAAAVVRHGDDDAGAIYIKVNRLDGSCVLFGPAPSGLDGAATDRRWVVVLGPDGVAEGTADERLSREAGFDPDLWIVEVEDRAGRHFLEDWLAPAGI